MDMNMKETYEKNLQAKLDIWRAEIEKLKAKARVAETGLQLKINEEVIALGDRVDKAQDKLEAFKAQTGAAGEELKSGLEKSWNDLTEAFKNAAERLH